MVEKTRGDPQETRRIGTTFVPVDESQQSEPPTDNDQDRAFDEFLSLSDQERSGINVWVYAMPTNERGETINGAKLEWLMTEPIDKYSQDELFRLIQTKWMRENEPFLWVRLMVRRARGAGVLKNMLFKLRALPKETVPAKNGAGDVPTILEAMSKMLQEQQARQDAFIARLAAPPAQAADPMAMMRGTIELLVPLLTVAAGNRPPAVDAFAQIKGMSEAMRSLNDLRSDLGGGGGDGGDSGMPGVVKAIASVAGPALQLLANQKTGHVVAAPAPAAAPLAVAPPGQPVQPPVGAADMPEIPQREPTLTELLALRNSLTRIAELMGRADTDTCANALLEDVPEAIDQWLYDQLSATDWFMRLSEAAPVVKGKEKFFSDIREKILLIYNSPEPAPPAT